MTKFIQLHILLIALLLSSCYSYDSKYENSISTTYKEIDHSFFWGIEKKESASNTERKCKNQNENISNIESKGSFLNYFIRIYTLGIYWPRTLEISCIE